MQSHTLKRVHKNKKSRQIGRGGVKAKTAGRGTKGQNARAGHKKRPELRDFIKRIPKLRGRGKNINTSRQIKPLSVLLSTLSKAYKTGETVSPATLMTKKVITSLYGRTPEVKILSTGDITIKLTIKKCTVSAGAQTKIEAAGGSVIV